MFVFPRASNNNPKNDANTCRDFFFFFSTFVFVNQQPYVYSNKACKIIFQIRYIMFLYLEMSDSVNRQNRTCSLFLNNDEIVHWGFSVLAIDVVCGIIRNRLVVLVVKALCHI